MRKITVPALGGVGAAFASMLCCSGPVFLAAAGLSGAGLATLRPYRPFFLGAAAVSLWLGFTLLERQERACEAGVPCASPRVRRRARTLLWLATALSVLLAASPLWAPWVV